VTGNNPVTIAAADIRNLRGKRNAVLPKIPKRRMIRKIKATKKAERRMRIRTKRIRRIRSKESRKIEVEESKRQEVSVMETVFTVDFRGI